MLEELIAPCGMNCKLCYAHLRDKSKCLGCRSETGVSNSCKRCIIKHCEKLNSNGLVYCYECEKFPCRRLKQLDKRYRTNYNMSMIDNLMMIKEKGIESFLSSEEKRWKCKNCGGVIVVHHKKCSKCKTSI